MTSTMSHAQLERSLEAIFDCLNQIRQITSEVLDMRDSRNQELQEAFDRLSQIIYSEQPQGHESIKSVTQ